jgi:tonB family C-terminal domain
MDKKQSHLGIRLILASLFFFIGMTMSYAQTKSQPTKEATASSQDDPEKIYESVDESPTFPGGFKALLKYLAKNIQYPQEAVKSMIQGKVILQFVIERDGTIGDLGVRQGVDPLLDAEAIRVVRSMPRWTPGKKDDKAVRCHFILPVVFRLK